MRKLVIIGAGGQGREVLWVARECIQAGEDWEIVGFIDDDEALHGEIICDVKILGGLSWFKDNKMENMYAVCGIGNTEKKFKIASLLTEMKVTCASLIHPSVCKSNYVEVGAGSVICAGCILTTQITIGKHVFLNLSCTVGHDATIEDFVTCAQGCNITGNTLIEEGAHLFTGVMVGPGKKIGAWSKIGANSLIINDIPSNVLAYGSPARLIRKFI